MSDLLSRFRDKYMGKPSMYRYLMVTIFLLTASVMTSAISQVGSHLEKIDLLFFSSQNESEDSSETAESFMNFERQRAMTRGTGAFHDISRGQIWRLVTPMFVHMDVLHIVFNMMWLWQFGVFLETRFGSWKFLGLVMVISAVANIAQAWFVGTSFGGMSGVNYGFFGFLLLRSRLHPDPSFVIRKEIVVWMLLWLVVCMTGRMGPVANHAHVGGFLCGGVIGTIHALRAGGWKLQRRRAQFKSALRASDHSMYRCVVCGATEQSHAERTFVVSRVDGQDYCGLHLPEEHK